MYSPQNKELLLHLSLNEKFSSLNYNCYNSINDNGNAFCTESQIGLCYSLESKKNDSCPFKTDNIVKLRKVLIKLNSEKDKSTFLKRFVCNGSSCDVCPFKGNLCKDWMFLSKEDKDIFSKLIEAIFTEKFDTLK